MHIKCRQLRVRDLEGSVSAALNSGVDQFSIFAPKLPVILRVLAGHQIFKALGHAHFHHLLIALSLGKVLTYPVHSIVFLVSGQFLEFAIRTQVLHGYIVCHFLDPAGGRAFLRVDRLGKVHAFQECVFMPLTSDQLGRLVDLVRRLGQHIAHILQFIAFQSVDVLVVQDVAHFLHLLGKALIKGVSLVEVLVVRPHFAHGAHPLLRRLGDPPGIRRL